jgi:hypothetical protein
MILLVEWSDTLRVLLVEAYYSEEMHSYNCWDSLMLIGQGAWILEDPLLDTVSSLGVP